MTKGNFVTTKAAIQRMFWSCGLASDTKDSEAGCERSRCCVELNGHKHCCWDCSLKNSVGRYLKRKQATGKQPRSQQSEMCLLATDCCLLPYFSTYCQYVERSCVFCFMWIFLSNNIQPCDSSGHFSFKKYHIQTIFHYHSALNYINLGFWIVCFNWRYGTCPQREGSERWHSQSPPAYLSR